MKSKTYEERKTNHRKTTANFQTRKCLHQTLNHKITSCRHNNGTVRLKVMLQQIMGVRNDSIMGSYRLDENKHYIHLNSDNQSIPETACV